MKEIKSVRVRRRDVNSGTLDIKVTIYEEKRTFGADERIVAGTNNDRPVWIATTYRKKDLYKEFTDDQFITDFIDMNAKSDGGGKEYEIIQDPWENKVPKWRNYGSDPYYLNNGAQIFISWTEGNLTAGGLTYSDDSGKEINGNVSISKTVFNIIGIDEPSVLQFGKSQEIEYKSFDVPTQVYGGLFEDIYIIQEIISAWKRKVPNYNELALCSPDNEKCSIIPYKSPLKPVERGEDIPPAVKVTVNEPPKEKMTVVLPPDVIKVKSDITSFLIYVGKVKEKELLNNPSTEQDEFIYDDSPRELDEYTESEFVGEGETILTEIEYESEMALALEESKGSDGGTGNSSTFTPTDIKGVPPNTALPTNASISAAFNNTPLYSQYDTRWANAPFDWTSNGKSCGDKSTVSTSGCGPSAVSMAINFWASKGYCKPVSPDIVAKFFADYGGRVCGSGSGLSSVPAEKFKQTFGIVIKAGATEAQIIASLKKGYPCVISGKNYSGYNFKGEKLSGKYGGGHFVCLTGIDGQGRIRVNDSGRNPSTGKSITASVENAKLSDLTTVNQKALLYPSSMSAPVA